MKRLFFIKILLIVFILFLNKKLLLAQSSIISKINSTSNSDYLIQNWNSENGLPQNSIIDILQTHDGFLWISTYNGLARFDGTSFKRRIFLYNMIGRLH